MKRFIALAALCAALICAASAPAAAQNRTCVTMPAGDASNACASDAFVQAAIAGFSITCPAHQFVNVISASGPTCAQPAFSDLSGNISVSQMNSGTGASSATFWRGDGTWATPTSGPGTPQGILRTVSVSGNVLTTDCGNTLQLQAPITLTLPVVGGFASNCDVRFVNTSTTRGVTMSGFPSGINSILFPKQGGEVQIVNGAWATISSPGRWRLPANTTVFFDNTNGLDTNDCLAAGSGNACKTPQGAWNVLAGFVDLNGFNPTLQSAAGQTYTSSPGTNLVIFTALVGGGNSSTSAGQVTIIDGANSTFVGSNNNTFAAITEPLTNPVLLQNMKISQAASSTIGACVGTQIAGYLQLGPGLVFQECAIDLFAATGGTIQILNNFTINANATVTSQIAFDTQLNGNIQGSGVPITVTLSGGPNWGTAFAASGSMSMMWLQSFTFSGASTGKRFICSDLSLMFTGTSGSATFFPGNIAGTTATGCIYD